MKGKIHEYHARRLYIENRTCLIFNFLKKSHWSIRGLGVLRETSLKWVQVLVNQPLRRSNRCSYNLQAYFFLISHLERLKTIRHNLSTQSLDVTLKILIALAIQKKTYLNHSAVASRGSASRKANIQRSIILFGS